MKYNGSWLNSWLQDWANDIAMRNGYPSANAIHKLMREGAGALSGEFKSQIPKGAEDSRQGHIRRLTYAMTLLRDEGMGKEMEAIEEWYLRGPQGKPHERMGYTARHFRRLKNQGMKRLEWKLEELRK